MSASLLLTRRDSLALGIAAATASLLPARALGQTIEPSPSLTRAGLVHDALLLLVSDNDVEGEWRDALLPLPKGKPFEFSYAYATHYLGDPRPLIRDVVAEVREGWADRKPAFMDIQRHKKGMMERRLTVALGAAANHVGWRTMRRGAPVTDLEIDGVFIRALANVDQIDQRDAERVFRVLHERALIAMHTVEPDLDGLRVLDITAQHEVDPKQEDVNRYIDAYADWVEGIDARCRELARAASGRPPRGFPSGTDFWRADEPIIAAAGGLRIGVGGPLTPHAFADAPGVSRYAASLEAGYAAARAVLEAARGAMPVADLDDLIAG